MQHTYIPVQSSFLFFLLAASLSFLRNARSGPIVIFSADVAVGSSSVLPINGLGLNGINELVKAQSEVKTTTTITCILRTGRDFETNLTDRAGSIVNKVWEFVSHY